jgi:hypothetical protein
MEAPSIDCELLLGRSTVRRRKNSIDDDSISLREVISMYYCIHQGILRSLMRIKLVSGHSPQLQITFFSGVHYQL